MREIEFRGKSISTGEWVYGDLVRDMSFHQDRSPEACVICWGNDYCPVDPETVGQFTGVCDKYSKDIYEDDIVKIPSGTSTVIFENGCFYTKIHTSNYRLGGWIGEIEVVGNIHEKKQL